MLTLILLRRSLLGQSLGGCKGLDLFEKLRRGHASVYLGKGITSIGNHDRTLAAFHIGVAILHAPMQNSAAMFLRVGRERSRDLNQEHPLYAIAGCRAKSLNRLCLFILGLP